jgi:hypothetical protein
MASSINLVFQILILLFIAVSVIIVKKSKFMTHGYLIVIAIGFNLISILMVMFPSAYRILLGASLNTFTASVVIHGAVGLLVEAFGIYIIYVWRFREPGPSCFTKRSYMGPTAMLWVLLVASGVMLYFMLS